MSDSTARQQAMALSTALKDFHRALIGAELGDDPAFLNPYTQLFALIGDPRFAWMSVVSRLIARIDDSLSDKSNDASDLDDLLYLWHDEAAELLGEGAQETDAQFRLRYLMTLQKDPEVGLATGRLRRVLAGMPRRPGKAG